MTRLATVFIVVAVLLAPASAPAFDWDSLWLNDDQRGAQRMDREEHTAAAEAFDDPRWRAAAWYRAGEYERAAAAWAGFDDTRAHYNRGNALARAGDIEAAIAAYETVLDREPGHADARHNLELLRELSGDDGQERGEDQDESRSADHEAEGESGGDGAGRDDPSAGEQRQAGGQQDGPPEEQSPDQATNGSQQAEQPEDGDPRAASQPDSTTSDQSDSTPGQPRDEASAERAATPPAADRAEQQAALDQWLRRVPDDPGGLLRRKFLYQYQRRERGDEGEAPW